MLDLPLHIGRTNTGKAATELLTGMGVMPSDAPAVPRLVSLPGAVGDVIEGVVTLGAAAGQTVIYAEDGSVPALIADGVAVARRDELTCQPDGRWRLALPGERILARAKTTTSGGTSELALARLFLPGWIKS